MTPTQPPEPQDRLSFDAEICERLSDRCRDIFLAHPEVQAIAATIVWKGTLNDADINHAVWIGPEGGVTSPAGIIASVYQTLKLLDRQMGRAMELAEHMRNNLQQLGEEAVKRHEELRSLQAKIEEAQAQTS